jgi:WD40 repeat protein
MKNKLSFFRLSCFFIISTIFAFNSWAQEQPRLVINSGHSDTITGIAFSPDGKSFATSSETTIKLWVASSMQEILNIEIGRENSGNRVWFSPDGNRLIAEKNGGIGIWETKNGMLLQTIPEYSSPVISPRGKYLAALKYSKVKIFETETGNPVGSFIPGNEEGSESAFISPDGRFLACLEKKQVRIWEVENHEEKNLLKQNAEIKKVAFSPDGKLLAVLKEDVTVGVWNLENGTEKLSFRLDEKLKELYLDEMALDFTADGKSIVTTTEVGVQVWNAADGKLLKKLGEYLGTAQALAPDGKTLLTAGSDDEGWRLDWWDLESGARLKQQTGKSLQPAEQIVFAANGSRLYTKFDGITAFWDLTASNGDKVKFLKGYFSPLSLSLDGKTLAFGKNNSILLIDTATSQKQAGELSEKFATENVFQGYRSLLHPDGKFVLANNENYKPGPSSLYDSAGTKIQVFEGHAKGTRAVLFSPDGKLLATAAANSIKIFNLATGKLLQALKSETDADILVFNASGSWLLSGGGSEKIELWSVASGKIVKMLTLGEDEYPKDLKFSPDGKTVAVGLDNGVIKLFDPVTGAETQKIAAHSNSIKALAFHPTGKFLLSAAQGDGGTKIWNLATGQLAGTLFVLGDGKWLVTTPDKRFDLSDEAAKLLHWVEDGKIVPLETYQANFRTSGLLQKIFAP